MMEADLQKDTLFVMDMENNDFDPMESSGVDIDSVDCIPDLSINFFDPETLPDVDDDRVFFLTQASQSIFSDMKASKFFNCLRTSSSWKLYVSELMFGLLFYEAPWNEAFQSNFLLRKLRDMGKIVVLLKDTSVEIPLSDVAKSVTNCRSLSVTHLRHGRVTQMFEFEITKADQTTTTCTHMGTSILEDIISSRSYTSLDCSAVQGFPQIFKEPQPELEPCCSSESDVESCTSSSSSYFSYTECPPHSSAADLTKAFSTVLKNIRESLLENNALHYKIVTSGMDKLVNVWYMKHLSEEFGSKVHVDQHFFTFIQRFLPDFVNAFTTQNTDGRVRFHFNCCDSWNKVLGKGCVPPAGKFQKYSADAEVDFICIGYWRNKLPRNFRIPKSRHIHCIPYIHEVIYDF